ncbi:MAG: helix-turn-helix transcriptional regulator [Pseudohongiella sp.]|nr:helix-turn-helix transcriptional regulator [Pseudohongiella sp.]
MLIYNINLDTLPLWLSFTLCLSMTAGGLLVLFRFRQTNSNGCFQYLQYFLILLYVYGYYSLWSGILLSGFMEIENIEWVATLLAQMGAPFLLVSLVMLLVWAARLQKQPALPLLLLTAGLSAAIFSGLYFSGWPIKDSVTGVCSILAMVSALSLLVILFKGKQAVVSEVGKRWLIVLAAGAGLIHLGMFTPLGAYQHYDSIFAFVFYLFNTAMVVVYCYHAIDEQMPQPRSLDDFLNHFGISKREADILRGIYAGKTNQEIANELFISLQTVKDHSSRIYQKTHVKNRAQLTTLVRESQSLIHVAGVAETRIRQ